MNYRFMYFSLFSPPKQDTKPNLLLLARPGIREVRIYEMAAST